MKKAHALWVIALTAGAAACLGAAGWAAPQYELTRRFGIPGPLIPS